MKTAQGFLFDENPEPSARRGRAVYGSCTHASRLEACAATATSRPRSAGVDRRKRGCLAKTGVEPAPLAETASALPLSYVPINVETIIQAARPNGPAPEASQARLAGADGGNRTRDPGTADRCVTTTLHLQGAPVAGVRRGRSCGRRPRARSAASAKNRKVSRAGIEPASCGLKDRCKGQRLLPARAWRGLHRRRALGENRTRAFSLRGNCTTVVLRGLDPRGEPGGNRTHVLRCKRPLQNQHLLPTRARPRRESNPPVSHRQ